MRFARAEEHELAARLEHGGQALEHQVEAFLPGQPRHHGDDRPRRLVQPELATERLAAGGLALGLVGGVRAHQPGVLGGIPLLVVDTVDHP